MLHVLLVFFLLALFNLLRRLGWEMWFASSTSVSTQPSIHTSYISLQLLHKFPYGFHTGITGITCIPCLFERVINVDTRLCWLLAKITHSHCNSFRKLSLIVSYLVISGISLLGFSPSNAASLSSSSK